MVQNQLTVKAWVKVRYVDRDKLDLFHGEKIFTRLFGFLPLFEFLKLQLFMPDSLSLLSHVFEKWKAWDFSRDPKSSWKCGGHRFWELTVVESSSYRVI